MPPSHEPEVHNFAQPKLQPVDAASEFCASSNEHMRAPIVSQKSRASGQVSSSLHSPAAFFLEPQILVLP